MKAERKKMQEKKGELVAAGRVYAVSLLMIIVLRMRKNRSTLKKNMAISFERRDPD